MSEVSSDCAKREQMDAGRIERLDMMMMSLLGLRDQRPEKGDKTKQGRWKEARWYGPVPVEGARRVEPVG